MLAAVVIALCVLSSGALLFWSFVLARVASAMRRVPTARAGRDLPPPEGGWTRVCVVVPAHNEEDCIADLARSLLEQDYPDLRIVFALDRCTDQTERVLREAARGDERVEIVTIESCPKEWAGKTHAAHRGVQDSAGARDAESLLFVDADTTLEPDCVRATVGLLRARSLGMLSLLSTLSSETWWERLIQPTAAFELVRHFPLDRVNDPNDKRSFANGQFMLFERWAYEKVGGHEAVKDELLEDVAFAKQLIKKRFRAPVGVLLADGMHRCRMYDSYEAFRRGWKRIYTESAGRRPKRLRRWSAQLVAMHLGAPSIALLTLIAGAGLLTLGDDAPLGWTAAGLGGAALLAWLAAAIGTARAQRAAWLGGLAAPYAAVVVAGLLRGAAGDLERGRGIEWAGRTYVRIAGDG